MPSGPAQIILIMGVAGSGKTTIGRLLAEDLGWKYFEADDFHPPGNIDKMARGIPLDDQDRAPWLAAIRARLDACLAAGENAVFTCSALKESYRRVLTVGAPRVSLIFLSGDYETIMARVGQRSNHYMKADMVRSQFDALEVPVDALILDIRESPANLVAEIKRRLAL